MDDIERLIEWMYDYFPEPTYTRSEVARYMAKNVIGWGNIPAQEKENILTDWETFVQEQAMEEFGDIQLREIPEIKTEKPSIWGRIKAFLGRFFGR